MYIKQVINPFYSVNKKLYTIGPGC